MTRLPMRYLPPQHFPNQYSPYQQYADPLTAAYLQQDKQAREENERRYLDLVAGRQGVRDRVTGDLANYGQSQLDDIERRSQVQNRNDLSDLASRGLGASNIGSSITRANNRERDAELRRAQDDIINRRVAADERTSDSLYGLIERRNDVQPNPNQLAQLSQGLGQVGYGAALGGGQRQIAYPGQMTGGSRSAGDYYNSLQFLNPDMARRMAQTPGFRPNTVSPMGGGASYAPPAIGRNGFEDQLGSATARYEDRSAQNYGAYPPPGMGYGNYGPPMAPATRMGLNAAYVPQNRPANPQAQSAALQSSRRAQELRDIETLKAQAAPSQAEWTNAMVDSWMGFGHNPKPRVISGAQGAPAMANIPQIGSMPSISYPNYTLPRYPRSTPRPRTAKPVPARIARAAANATPSYTGDINPRFATYV